MKIFSFEFKTFLVWLAIMSGVVIDTIISLYVSYGNNCWVADWPGQKCWGWPMPMNSGNLPTNSMVPLLVNLFFWILISFAVLSLFKYFKSKH